MFFLFYKLDANCKCVSFCFSANEYNDACLFIRRPENQFDFVVYQPARDQHFRLVGNFMRLVSRAATVVSWSYHYRTAHDHSQTTWEQIMEFLTSPMNPFNRLDLRAYDTTNRY